MKLAKLFKLNVIKPERRALKKAGRKALRMEEAGQLNMFDNAKRDGKVIQSYGDAFQQALHLDDENSPMALEAYRQAVKQGINTADALCNIATIEAMRGDLPAAIAALSEALVENPRHALAHYNLGNVYLEAGNLQLAELHYDQALRNDPLLSEVYYNLALVLLIGGKRERAAELLELYRELSSEPIDIENLIDRLLG